MWISSLSTFKEGGALKNKKLFFCAIVEQRRGLWSKDTEKRNKWIVSYGVPITRRSAMSRVVASHKRLRKKDVREFLLAFSDQSPEWLQEEYRRRFGGEPTLNAIKRFFDGNRRKLQESK